MHLQQQPFDRQRPQPPYRQHRIFQVIQQTEAQRQVEPAQLQYLRTFHVPSFKRNRWESPTRLRHIFRAPIEPAHIQPAFLQDPREESHTAARIQRRRQSHRLPQLRHHMSNRFPARPNQLHVRPLIELRQLDRDCARVLARAYTRPSQYDFIHNAHRTHLIDFERPLSKPLDN